MLSPPSSSARRTSAGTNRNGGKGVASRTAAAVRGKGNDFDALEQLLRPCLSTRGETHVLNKAIMEQFNAAVQQYQIGQKTAATKRRKRRRVRQRKLEKVRQQIERERRNILRTLAKGEALNYDKLLPLRNLIDECHTIQQRLRIDAMSPTEVAVLEEQGMPVFEMREPLTPDKWVDLVLPKFLPEDQAGHFADTVRIAVDGQVDEPTSPRPPVKMPPLAAGSPNSTIALDSPTNHNHNDLNSHPLGSLSPAEGHGFRFPMRPPSARPGSAPRSVASGSGSELDCVTPPLTARLPLTGGLMSPSGPHTARPPGVPRRPGGGGGRRLPGVAASVGVFSAGLARR